SDATHRRRRRRRRRGEDISGSDDDPSDVVIKVREPRSRQSVADEVTGIEGSTRVEAKKQRRREGRAAGRRRSAVITDAEFLARRESVDRKMIVRQSDDYSQLAVLEDGVLVEHY
ncbi:ribonuclease, partial [Xanthomonas citri pv. citri]|nr:ribonuclease [Xanthomonas citri pv. citri]